MSVLKIRYTVAELAEMNQVNEKRMRASLREKGLIPAQGQRGKKEEILLSRFVEAFPEVWESIRLAAQLRGEAA
jgi:hypothetical protein